MCDDFKNLGTSYFSNWSCRSRRDTCDRVAFRSQDEAQRLSRKVYSAGSRVYPVARASSFAYAIVYFVKLILVSNNSVLFCILSVYEPEL